LSAHELIGLRRELDAVGRRYNRGELAVQALVAGGTDPDSDWGVAPARSSKKAANSEL